MVSNSNVFVVTDMARQDFITCAPCQQHNATHYVRRFLTARFGIPLATSGMEEEDAHTLWFHDKDSQGHHRQVRVQRRRTQGLRSSLRNVLIPAGPRRDQEGYW